ncbi:ABC transporter substrate-binding protein [Psychrobium sp. 1_MG-2023]|nr:ABC transporter substrate-binding protein [Psychrobium sp. 1_MG-2023]MDP2561565.1 ABC transporter substrate-binding protein [Psychrobium sp. 1_MG-2023]
MIALLVVSAISSLAQGRTYDDIIETKQLIVSVYRDFAPFSFEKDGKAHGIDVDIAKQIAKSLNVELTVRFTTADESVEDDLRNTLWKGDFQTKTKSDLMMRVPYDRDYSQMRDDIGELVHDRVHMFAPYHTESWQIAFNKNKIEEVSTMAVFQYHDIGVEVDTVPAFYLTGAFRGTMTKHTHHYPNIRLARDAMLAEEVDAIMGLRSEVSHLLVEQPANFELATNAFPLIGRQQWDIGMAVKSDYRQLSYAIGDVVTEMVKNGQMARIFEQYGSIYQQPTYYNP